MNLFRIDASPLTQEDVALGQELADISTVGLLQQRRALEQDILTPQLQAALRTRIVIEQAKEVLSERAGVSVGEAFVLMRARARRTEQPLTTVAYAGINGGLGVAERVTKSTVARGTREDR